MRNFVSSGWFAFLVSATLFGTGAYVLRVLTGPVHSGPTSEPIVVQCAEALRVPLEAIKARYEEESGQPIELRFGPSQSLLAQLNRKIPN